MSNFQIFDRHSWGAIREARGITYAQLGELCGVHLKSVSKWFYGERRPSLHHTILLAKALDIPLNQVLKSVTDSDIRSAIRSIL
ncbi:helix-turn-helix transcriptional regulator [Streptomyces sp. NPDC047860]|uniref:helix-turn-helix domain-containing protein n=1 Tax=Streptomyces sp. NPDC047860 TaxID=3155743 RepID=UPI0033CA61A5